MNVNKKMLHNNFMRHFLGSFHMLLVIEDKSINEIEDIETRDKTYLFYFYHS